MLYNKKKVNKNFLDRIWTGGMLPWDFAEFLKNS